MQDYVKPGSIAEAVEALRAPGAMALCGGTDLLVKRRMGIVEPQEHAPTLACHSAQNRRHGRGDGGAGGRRAPLAPAQGIDGATDVALADGKIAAVVAGFALVPVLSRIGQKKPETDVTSSLTKAPR